MFATLRCCACANFLQRTCLSTAAKEAKKKYPPTLELCGKKYPTDDWTNLTAKIMSQVGANIHLRKDNPLSLLRRRIVNYFYENYRNRSGTPIFSVADNLSPVVSVVQNFESLLVASDHPSRAKSDCYYVNSENLLRAHTTAHQAELLAMGLDNFLIVGDVYRRDEIDSTHYPIFHQIDAVRLRSAEEISIAAGSPAEGVEIFDRSGRDCAEKQSLHSLEAVKIMEHDLKKVLVGLVRSIFGKDVQTRWVGECFPFTHPSWELEIFHNGEWMEILGCGIMRQEILNKSGVQDRIGWAFGLGLERLAMCLYDIPDIRLFWSNDTGFTSQFDVQDVETPIKYKPISVHPQCTNDLSFWLPEVGSYSANDFYDIVREIGGDCVEQISLVDEFVHPKTKKVSHCYRIVYRHMERTLRKRDVNVLHQRIVDACVEQLSVVVR